MDGSRFDDLVRDSALVAGSRAGWNTRRQFAKGLVAVVSSTIGQTRLEPSAALARCRYNQRNLPYDQCAPRHGDCICSKTPFRNADVSRKNREIFRDSCIEHDACWTTCGTPQRRCDRIFLSNMGNACARAYRKDNVGRKACKAQALAYYAVLRSPFAKGYYDDNQASVCCKFTQQRCNQTKNCFYGYPHGSGEVCGTINGCDLPGKRCCTIETFECSEHCDCCGDLVCIEGFCEINVSSSSHETKQSDTVDRAAADDRRSSGGRRKTPRPAAV